MNVVKTLNLRVMAGRIAVAAHQLDRTKTGGFCRIQLLMNIGEEQNRRRMMPQLFGNIAIGLRFSLGSRQGVEIATEQMSNITFVAVAK